MFYVCKVPQADIKMDSFIICYHNSLQGSCLCSQVQNSGKVIYCYGDLLPRHNSIIAPEENKQDSSTSPKDLIAAQLGVWTCGLLAL